MKQSNNLTMEEGPFHLPHWAVILLLLFVPPIAWWHMWKNHRYHSWFPYVLWLNAAVTLGFAAYIVVHFHPLLTTFYDSATYIFASHIGLLLFAVFEIVFGFYLIKMFKNEAILRRRILAIVISLLFINTIAIPLSQLIITSTIQSRFEKNPAVTSTNQKEASTVHPDEIGANWKTYVSNDKSFSLQYPSSWKKDADEPGQEVVLIAPVRPECAPPQGCGGGLDGLSVSIQDNPNALSLQEFIKENKQNMYSSNHFVKNTTSLGIPTDWVIERNTPGAGSGQEILLAHGTKVIDLYCGSCSNERVDQILSTFKFLDN